MVESDHEDRLIHVLLEEQFGGDAPPDLRVRILAAARGRRRLRWMAAAAAVLVAAGAGLLAWRVRGYPSPRASGKYVVVGGGSVGRGATLEAGIGGARLDLGGYCSIEVAPGSVVRIEGEARKEQLELTRGEVTCAVASGQGAFSVHTELGSVSVTGTRFVVRYDEGEGETRPREMFVKVLAGAVLLTTMSATESLMAGDEKRVSDSKEGKVSGTFWERNSEATKIAVKVSEVHSGSADLKGQTVAFGVKLIRDGDKWVASKEQKAVFRKLKRGDKVRIAYTAVEETKRVDRIQLWEGAGKSEK